MTTLPEEMQIPPPLSPGETGCANAIFQQPWWLDAVAPGQWAEVTCEHDGRIVARLPYVVRGRRGLRILTQSSLTHTLGPWVEPRAPQAVARPRPGARAARSARGDAPAGPGLLTAVLASDAQRAALPLGGVSARGSLHVQAARPALGGRALGRPARQRPPGDPQGAQAGGGRGRPRCRSVLRRPVEDVRPAADRDSALAGRARAPGVGMRAPRGGGHALRARRRRPGPRRGMGGVGPARRLLPAGGRRSASARERRKQPADVGGDHALA